MKSKITLLLSLLYFMSVFIYGQNYSIITDIPYTGNPTSDKQKLDIYIPEEKSPMPCLVWIHGGAWLAGSKNGLAGEIDTLLHHGYVVASIGYRLSSEVIFPAQIFDCKTAIRFLKARANKYQIDSTRIAVAGASAGGHLAALLGTSADVEVLEDKSMGFKNVSSRVHAVIDYYGPTDFLIMDDLPDTPPEKCENPMVHLTPNSPESLLLGCNIEECPEKVKMANPITYITDDDPPFLIFHGTFDCTVTPKSSVILEKALRKNKIQANLYLLPGAGHGGEQFLLPNTKRLVLQFLETNLK
jgi:acetyl esterase/lipase